MAELLVKAADGRIMAARQDGAVWGRKEHPDLFAEAYPGAAWPGKFHLVRLAGVVTAEALRHVGARLEGLADPIHELTAEQFFMSLRRAD